MIPSMYKSRMNEIASLAIETLDKNQNFLNEYKYLA